MASTAASGLLRFDRFELDADNRQLRCDGAPVELSARYFDALILLVGEAGRLVSKDRFMAEVWRGVPVTDEALTQCVRSLRRALGDDAARPRFIETVPKHGYRFIAPLVEAPAAAPEAPPTVIDARNPKLVMQERRLIGAAGALGGAGAGAIGGLIYGFAAAASSDVGAASTFLVLMVLTTVVGLVGGAGVSFGMSLAGYTERRPGMGVALMATFGGLLVGAVFRMLGSDAFDLLFGHAPRGITGPLEGGMLGLAIGIGAVLGGLGAHEPPLRLSMTAAGLTGALGGVIINLGNGRLMGGSLERLAAAFPGSHLRLDAIGGLFGETGLGPVSLMVTGGLEGALFGSCVVGAMIVARRSRRQNA